MAINDMCSADEFARRKRLTNVGGDQDAQDLVSDPIIVPLVLAPVSSTINVMF